MTTNAGVAPTYGLAQVIDELSGPDSPVWLFITDVTIFIAAAFLCYGYRIFNTRDRVVNLCATNFRPAADSIICTVEVAFALTVSCAAQWYITRDYMDITLSVLRIDKLLFDISTDALLWMCYSVVLGFWALVSICAAGIMLALSLTTA